MNHDQRTHAVAAEVFHRALQDHRAALDTLGGEHIAGLSALAEAILVAWRGGGKLLVCGNGGSAADSQHLAAELAGRYERQRSGWAALALTTDTSALTAISNDFGFEKVFARQVEALGRSGDVLLVISTSGNSANCVEAVRSARAQGMATHGLLGGDGGTLRDLVGGALLVPVTDTPRVQELHIVLIHMLCELLEARRIDGEGGDA